MLRAISAVLPALSVMDAGLRQTGLDLGSLATFLAPLQSASDEDTSRVFKACLDVCERQDGDVWIPARGDIGLAGMIDLVMAVTADNFTAYFAMPKPEFRQSMGRSLDFEPAMMPDGEDWLWRPVDAGMLPFMAAYDGITRIEHFAKANAVLDVRAENEARVRRAAERK